MSDSTATAETTTTQETVETTTTEPQGTAADTSSIAQPATGEQEADDTDWKAQARKWEDRAKENKRAAETAAEKAREDALREFAQKLGLVESDGAEAPTVESMAQKLADAEDRAAAAERKLAVVQAAPAARADVEMLLDSETFKRTLTTLDPADGDSVTNAIKDFVSKNPRFLTQAVGSSSADHAGGSGEGHTSKYKPGMSIADSLVADAG